MKKGVNNFQSKLVKTQVILIMPILIVLLIGSFSLLYSSTSQRMQAAVIYQLNNFDATLEGIVKSTLKLLEKPYNNAELYQILSTEYEENDVKLYRDDRKVLSILYNDIMFYNDYVGAAIIVASNRETPYLKYASPFLLTPNYNLKNLDQLEWYNNAMEQTSYTISDVHFDPMFTSLSRVIEITQQIREPLSKKSLGVIKLNLNFEDIMKLFPRELLGKYDAFYVTSRGEAIIYKSENYQEQIARSFQGIHIYNLQTGLTFTYLISPQSILDQLILPYAFIVVGIALIFFVCIYYIRRKSSALSEPIVSLKDSMVKAQQGDLNTRSKPLEGEMMVLANAFNELMDKTEVLIDDVRRQEQEKSSLQYELLQSKVNPHFLYNSLNALKWKAQSVGTHELAQSIDSLAMFLKNIIKVKSLTMSVEEELILLEHYITIMQTRYDNDIEINYDVDTELFNYRCPKMILQPVIENCFIHAFQDQINKQIDVIVYQDMQDIVFVIKDNGCGVSSDLLSKISAVGGIGLKATDERLKRIYGQDYGISVESIEGYETSVAIRIPMIKEDDDENFIG